MAVRNSKRLSKRVIILLVIGIVIVLSVTGSVLAKYIAENLETDDAVSGKFYFSSDTLKKATVVKDANNWVDGITFEVYNYEISNPALVSDDDIEYEFVNLPTGWEVSVTDSDGNPVTPTGGLYKMVGSSVKEHHTITIKSSNPQVVNIGDAVNVKVKTKTPYVTELSADFKLIGSPLPDYKIENNSTYVLVTLYANLYDGNVSVQWTTAFLPDNANPLMSGWTDNVASKELSVEKNHTYELIFFKNTTDEYSKALQNGKTTIIIGE